MAKIKLNQLLIYRWRYIFGYGIFFAALAFLLIIAGFYLPGGLSDAEIRSAMISDSLNPSKLYLLPPDQLVSLPYRLVQAASISLFGFNLLGIKAPSIILGFVSALAMLYLLNLWFRRNVAIITAVISVTTTQFILASQAGQAGITYIFLSAMILISAFMITRRNAYANIWVIVGFVLAAISVYMPLNVYFLLALVITMVLHPHARYVLLKRSSKPTLIVGSLAFIVIISPLILGVIRDASVLLTLAGVPEDGGKILSGAMTLLNNYTNFSSPSSGATLVPIYGLGILLLIALGLYRLINTKYTARSYLLISWLLLLTPLIILNPNFISITFIPVMLLIGLAVEYLIRSWYRLFPRNPYARLFGMIPLAILMSGIIISSVDRYAYGFHYDSKVFAEFNFDIPVLSRYLSTRDKDQAVTLVVPAAKKSFYENYARHQKYVRTLEVVSQVPNLTNTNTTTLVERSLKRDTAVIPTNVLVIRAAENADRFYLYQPADS